MNASIKLPLEHGNLDFQSFPDGPQIGLLAVNRKYGDRPFVRIHSSCVFSEAFHTIDCDCGRQLQAALSHIQQHGGIVLYLYQEGRGVGLAQKIQSIALEQQKDCDTAAAFAELGHPADPRKYDSAIQVLKRMGISKITLDTSNPNKISALEVAGIHVEHISLPIESNEMIDEYRKRKRRALGHHG